MFFCLTNPTARPRWRSLLKHSRTKRKASLASIAPCFCAFATSKTTLSCFCLLTTALHLEISELKAENEKTKVVFVAGGYVVNSSIDQYSLNIIPKNGRFVKVFLQKKNERNFSTSYCILCLFKVKCNQELKGGFI